jgi:DNA-binding response OmpR family regulator
MRLLVVEDEPRLASFIQQQLVDESYAVDVAETGEVALQLAQGTAYDLVVLDIMLSGIDGFAVCRELRARQFSAPILMLSARRLTTDRVRGLDTGADDYLTKPFEYAELSARVRALLRRREPYGMLMLQVGDLTLDPLTRTVKRGERRIELTLKEFALLEYLMRNAEQAVTRAMIAEQVWNLTWDRLTNLIDVFISHLREKLEEAGEPRLIYSVRGVGYVIRAAGDGD